ncbi:MAG: rod shape-determining protein MreD [Gemmatimonadota bacterium]|nr:rod shape-determining protein MreD [Gemmatimonadota bacterium]
MSVGAALRTAGVVAVLVVLQFAVQPLVPWRVSPDFLVIALLYAAVRIRPGAAAVLGFALGLVTDSLTLGGFGAGALAMTVVGFGASWLKAAFFADTPGINAAFLFVGKWVFDVIYVLAQHTMPPGQMLAQIFVWSVLSAAFTAVVGALVFAVVRPVSASGARRA